jgi:CheY-like chemotaxis protein
MGKKKVLLVDDELVILEIMKKRLANWGYEPLVASGGKEAIDIVKSQNPDIVILDYMMPGMDGIATLEEVRKITDKLPVVIFTGYYPDERAIDAVKKLGIDAYIPKLDAYTGEKTILKSTLEKITEKLDKE